MRKLWQRILRRIRIGALSFIKRAGQVWHWDKWFLWLGSSTGLGLAVVLYLALLHSAATPTPVAPAATERAAIEKKLSANFGKSLPMRRRFQNFSSFRATERDQLLHFLKLDSSRQNMTLRDLLHFRRQALEQTRQLYYSTRLLRDSTRLADIESDDRRDNCHYMLQFQNLLLPIIDSIQQDVASTQLRYLEQPQEDSVRLVIPFRRRLARLQLADATLSLSLPFYSSTRPGAAAPRALPHSGSARFTRRILADRKVRLATDLELRRMEVSAQRDPLSAQLLDSCLREVNLLRWLDSCRAEAATLIALETASEIPVDSSAGLRLPFSQLAPASTMLTGTGWAFFWEKLLESLPTIGMWLLLAVPLMVIGLSIVLVWRSLPVPATPVAEPLVLQLLLLAYAHLIRTILRAPRQIKRFAGKARLQHHLLRALARQSNTFSFGPAEQVFAFQLLLLIEQDAQTTRALARAKDEATFSGQLQALYWKACAASTLDAELPEQFRYRRDQVRLRAERLTNPAQPLPWTSCPPAFAAGQEPTENQQALLRQLYWLNAGLLV